MQSALGEALRAEIDVTSLTPEESANLRVRIAPPDAYRIAGVDYNPVLPQTSVAVQRRPDGSAFLRISSNQSVQEPFVDVILELSWSSGRLLREYTLLFDPPATAKAPSAPAPAVAAAPPVAAPVPVPVPAPAVTPPPAPAVAATPAAEPAPAPVPAPAAAVAEAAPTAPATALGKGELAVRGKSRPAGAETAAAAEAPAPSASDAAATELKVRSGDTLSSIARKVQPTGVSLDQMLVGLYQGNPQAFVGNNMNRLRSGVILNVPAGEQLSAIDAQEARRVIVAQSADFNAYRQRLASVVPAPASDAAPARQGGGKVTAEVQDQKQPAAQAQDRLKLDKSKTTAGKAADTTAEDKIATELADKEAKARANELVRNVEELKKLQAASASTASAPAPTPAVASAPAVPAPTLPVAKPAEPVASAPEVVAAASAPLVDAAASAASAADAALAAASAAMSESAAPASAAASAAPAAPIAADEPSLLEGLSENPWVLPGAGVILALLAGLGYYRLRGRNKEDAGVTSFLESRLQPDSFFGASGGQRVDTRDASGAPSSMSYSLSQIDAIGDVDPVAEADVYLAYGRDLQAEEILKEAMRANPDRLAIRTKLLEVYAKRRDTKGYELLAGELYGLTGGQGEDWTRAQELGRSIDPDNTLYEPGGAPGIGSTAEAGGGEPLGASTMPQSIVPSPSRFEHSVPDLDLSADPMGTPSAAVDLDISVPAAMDDGQRASSVSNTFPSVPSSFGSAPSAFDSRPARGDFQGSASLDFELDDLPRTSAPSAASPTIDLADLSLDLDAPLSRPGSIPAPLNVEAYDSGVGDDGSDPLARKLELAEEFNQIGDFEGARDLLQEVIDNADGTLRAKAQAMLDKLG